MDTVMRHIAAKTLMELRGADGRTGWLRQVPEARGRAITGDLVRH
ncbi:hypothetical protein [Paenibacillus chitinolyticus]